jgi:hypothetical protein
MDRYLEHPTSDYLFIEDIFYVKSDNNVKSKNFTLNIKESFSKNLCIKYKH